MYIKAHECTLAAWNYRCDMSNKMSRIKMDIFIGIYTVIPRYEEGDLLSKY